jgi:uncharacterized membrane protein
MMVWPLFQKLPVWLLAILGIVIVMQGYYFNTIRVEPRWLFPLGLRRVGFATADYFPIFPEFGWFLLGAVLGKTVYRKKQTLLPRVNAQAPILRFFCFCGRQSLPIYLVHQPLLSGILTLVTMLK